ncbi:hypothetical protein McpSp1_10660 [Methanocorpusculaceae archaeon Sp1]|nr:hypothetical protein [Methanocorpusculaceae archaeon Sp1]
MQQKRLSINANITVEETKTLDKILHAAGFQTRTDYITALLQTTIYGTAQALHKLPSAVDSWIHTVRDLAQTRDKILHAILDAYDEIALPVIAMRGGKTALELLRSEIEASVLEKCGVLPAPEDLDTCMKIYQNIRRPTLLQHRTAQLADQYRANISAPPSNGGTQS